MKPFGWEPSSGLFPLFAQYCVLQLVNVVISLNVERDVDKKV